LRESAGAFVLSAVSKAVADAYNNGADAHGKPDAASVSLYQQPGTAGVTYMLHSVTNMPLSARATQ